MYFKLKTIDLSSINTEDYTFRITTEVNINDLVNSIDKLGIINLPLLIEKRSYYIIVCGFRRIKACKSLGRRRVEAMILDHETKMLDCIKIAVTDNAFQRPLNLVEKSRSINMLSNFFKDSNSLAKEMSKLGLTESQSSVDKIINICHFPWAIQNAIISNTISLTMALELVKLPNDSVADFVKLFENLKLSLNKQREITTFVKEIALRDNIPILKVLKDKRLLEILNKKDFDRNQKTRKIRIYLKQRRFPALTEAEKSFEKHKKKLNLASGAKLIPPDNFEDKTYTLQFSFKNLNELKDRKAAFDSIIENPSIKKILH